MNGTALHGERVVIVEVHSGRVDLKTGHISSKDSSPAYADNRTRTLVSGDRELHPVTDGLDDAYETSFQVDNIHLLKEQDVERLQDPETAQDWFGSIYQDSLVAKIHRALKRLKWK